MKYYLTYLYAICKALLHSNSKLYFVVADKKYIKPTMHFKNGSYIKVIAPNNEENNCRGKRAKVDLWEDLNTPSEEEIAEVLKSFITYDNKSKATILRWNIQKPKFYIDIDNTFVRRKQKERQ